MKNRITVFVVPPFSCTSAEGGAENICRIICLALSKEYDIFVIHSERNPNKPLGNIKQHGERLFSCNAFYLDFWTYERGEVSPTFCEEAKNRIQESDLLISFERTVLDVNIPQITVLGGISYLHCKDIAASMAWDKLIVPSQFIKKQCGSIRNDTCGIQVIYNGINCNRFYKYNEKRTYVALLPFRPDRGKGFFESIDFISIVNMIGQWGKYSILVTRSDDPMYLDFYNEFDKYARDNNVETNYVSWSTPDNMNSIYNKADFVLALGSLEEGFGLTTIESVLAGRSVIANQIGATPEVLPQGLGVAFLKMPISLESVTHIMEYIISDKMNNDLNAGALYIKNKYNENRMCEEMNLIVKEYLK